MAVPTAYTEAELKAYMHTSLGNVAAVLGLSVASGNYNESVTDTLLAYGVNDIAEATDITKLRRLAVREAWRLAQASAAAWYDFSADGGQYSRSQLNSHIAANLARAETTAAVYDSVAYSVSRTSISYQDAYSDEDTDE